MLLLIASVSFALPLDVSPQQASFTRTFSPTTPAHEVELATASPNPANYVGNTWRNADHATVAMNSNLDIAVAFHSDRTDAGSGLKQVEVAYYEYQGWVPGGTDSWEHVATRVVGSIYKNPLTFLQQPLVKCERPDIIAVGTRFFVVWTRRYEGTTASLEHHPAVLECAWIERGSASSDFVVHDSGSPGLGYELQAHVPTGGASQRFEILDCAGVADAVELQPLSTPTTKLKVAVAYPHQSAFPNLTLPVEQHERIFELRLVTCEFDTTNNSLSKLPPTALNSNIQFHGPKGLNNTTTAGLILPDLAPSAEPNSLWIAAEGQVMAGPPTARKPHGIIKLQYWNSTEDGAWQELASKSFLSTGTPYQSRRRPSLSSYTPATPVGGPQVVSIAFNRMESEVNPSDLSINVVHEEWSYSAGSISPVTPPTMNSWLNSSSQDDLKPVALRGIDSPALRRCYFSQIPNGLLLPKDLLSHDSVAGTSAATVLQTLTTPNSSGELTRPAVAYQHQSAPATTAVDHVAVAFEGKKNTSPRRVRIGVE